MSTYKNPAVLQGKAIPQQAGEVVVNRDVFDLADTSYAPTDINNGDLIQIGVVPAGCKLIPHLCCIKVPAIDSNGSPTGDYTIGTEDDPDALKGSAASETAVTLFGEDFVLTTADIGAKYEDVPIYVKAVADSATTPATGKFIADLALRAFDSSVDTDVT